MFLIGGAIYGEIGAVVGVLTPMNVGPGISLGSRLHTSMGFMGGLVNEGRSETAIQIISQVDATAYYEFASARPYVGVTTHYPIVIERREQFSIVPAAVIGIALKARRTELTFELKSSFLSLDFDHTNRGLFGLGVSISGR
jgi:hypothetical protein